MSPTHMTRARRWGGAVLAAAVLVGVAACGDDDTSGSGESSGTTATSEAGRYGATSTTTAATSSTGTSLEVAGTELGQIVIDGGSSLTVYVFTDDTATTIACLDACVGAWPPVVGPATAGEGLDAAALGTVTRPDGSTQATYQGHPLYTYAADSAPGDTQGQGVGGKWFVIGPDGAPIRT